MSWIINEDLIDEGLAVGTQGPADSTHTANDIQRSPNSLPFCMYDDDGELYYRGLYLEDEDSDELQPLDDFGTPNAGCTEIRMLNKKTGRMESV